MVRTYDFLAPSLHPNTLLDISIPEPGPSSLEPIVKHLPIKHNEHAAVGTIKRLHQAQDANYIAADDAFRISTLSLDTTDEGPAVPSIIAQETVAHRSGDIWSGLVSVQGGTISALSSGLLTLHPNGGRASSSRTILSPLLAISSPSPDSNTFAIAGKEVDVSVWDVERTFAAGASSTTSEGGKRKKNELEAGEAWRAKNMPNNHLALRPPNHHLSLTHLTLRGPTHLASGTKSGTVRVYDTRQRKPVHEWKIAREGGIGSICQGQDDNEIFFSDRANLLGAMDLRTGRLLYSYPNLSCTPHHLLPLPSTTVTSSFSSPVIRLATVASDAALRIHSTLPPKKEGEKGNLGGGRKAKVEGMVGGVGIASFVFKGHGEIADPVKETKKRREGEVDDDEDEDEEDGDSDDEEVWEGMSEVEDEGSESEDEVEVPKKKSRK